MENIRLAEEIRDKLKAWNLVLPPIGVKFSLIPQKPEGILRIKKRLRLCEMIGEAQINGAFFAEKEDMTCPVGPLSLGMLEKGHVIESGALGAKLGYFDNMRVNRLLYDRITRIPAGKVTYIAFAPLDEIQFDPDLMIFSLNPEEAKKLLWITNYTSLRPWHSELYPVIQCNWLFMRPYVTGEIYYLSVTEPSYVYGHIKPGMILVSIPYQLFPTFLYNLKASPEKLKEAEEDRIMESIEKELQEGIF